jgi:predicted RND superfamily exporter protein
LIDLKVNETTKRFDVKPLLTQKPKSQAEVDSIKEKIANLKFYDGMVINTKTNTTLMAITFNEKALNSKKRISIVQEIRDLAHQFEEKHHTTLHLSGMPFIRTATMQKVSHEMELFMGLAVLVTAAILWFFFRSIRFTLVSILVVLIGVVFSVGTLVMMGYKITMLTGLIPPLLIVIGVPNCIFLINRYQAELSAHGDKQLAIHNMITGIGLSTFLPI